MHPRFTLALAAALATCSLAAQADPVPGMGSWQTVLQPRDLNNDGAVDAWYDASSHLSWTANASLLGAAAPWADVQAAVTGLNLFGVTGWRLPTLQAVAGGVPACPAYTYDGSGDCGYNVDPGRSEMAHMYQVVLGNLPWRDTVGTPRPPGWGLVNTGPFANLVPGDYPTAITVVGDDGAGGTFPGVWLFETTYGYQDGGDATAPTFHAWAVFDGDVMAAVPEPAPLLLGLAGWALLLLRRRYL